MKLYYHKCQHPNFGDEINLWFWERIFNCKFDGDANEMFVGIGTLINEKLPVNNKVHIVGSGLGYNDKPLTIDKSWNIHCVRGPLTAKYLGIDEKKAIVDPAVLLPIIHPLNEEKKIKLAFMPHIGIDSDNYRALIESFGITYLSPTEDTFSLLKKISQTERLITSAMHGAIIADAYRVPWAATVTSPEILNFKWQDWCASLSMEYQATTLPSFWDYNNSSIVDRCKAGIKSYMIKNSIEKIANTGVFNLSNAKVLEDKQTQLREKLEEFKTSYLT